MARQTLDEQLRRAFERSDISLFQLAREAELGYAIVHGWYNGDRGLTLASADKIAAVLGLSLRGK